MNFNAASGQPFCRIIRASQEDVPRAYGDLNRDMDPQFVHVFLDKIQRYASKTDRDLFLAEYRKNIIAFATIIEESPVPDDMPEECRRILKDYACGTGLMVLPEYRNQGVASKLVKQWQLWAVEKKCTGVWIVTRKMADWYQRCFQFSLLGDTICRRVKKTILAKAL